MNVKEDSIFSVFILLFQLANLNKSFPEKNEQKKLKNEIKNLRKYNHRVMCSINVYVDYATSERKHIFLFGNVDLFIFCAFPQLKQN